MSEFTSERSLRVRSELVKELVIVLDIAIQHIDFQLIEGKRETTTQQRYYAEGSTQYDGITQRSNHQVDEEHPLARAFDFIPSPFTVWDDRPLFTAYAYFFVGIGVEKGIQLTWGGDWDGDFRWRDQSFHDFPHIELR